MESDSHKRFLGAYEQMNAGRYIEARAAFEQLLSEGEQRALIYLGWMDEQGLGGTADELRAAARYKVFSDQGDPVACYYLASLKLKQADVQGALPLFLLAANAGHPSAAYWASAIYDGEYGEGADCIKAATYLARAAELGHIFAQRDLAAKRMRESSSFISRAKGAIDYVGAKLRGLVLIIRDANDPRIR
jgi:TPR repeat protein